MSQKHSAILVVALALAALASLSCGGIEYPYLNQPLYTLTNLHPDEKAQRMYSINYQQEGLIPVCTPVTVVGIDDEEAQIVVNATGRTYQYVFNAKFMRTTIQEHMAKFFGPQCDKAAIAQMSPVDQQGIAGGKVLVGMTKNGVLLAAGYPPEHVTPDLQADRWQYWTNRVFTYRVLFQNGVVTSIDGGPQK